MVFLGLKGSKNRLSVVADLGFVSNMERARLQLLEHLLAVEIRILCLGLFLSGS